MNNNDIIAPTDIEVAPHSNQAIDHVKAFSQNVVLETYEDCHFYDLDALGLKAPCQELISIAPELQVSLRPVDTSDGPQDKKRKKRTKEHFGRQKLPNNELLTMTEETVTTCWPMEKDVVTSAGRSGDTPTSSQSSQQSSSALCPCRRSGNKDCRNFSGPLCSTCCGKASGFVCCYPHMTAQNSHLPAIIDAAIEKGSTLKITYDSGQNKNRGARNIIPRGWRRNGKTSFNADDLTFSVEARHVSKTFKVAWIRSQSLRSGPDFRVRLSGKKRDQLDRAK
ncbi:hypothetical protein PROFUN_00007 [Planoprotostelium fungivorum]|uniref:Uncharacterized protein n=1 Tax=Planoprotostelium fungivorum TaxID=1890364 RepID=A0A2P6P0B9_9EUKA|nr:hypothetical protein PROFUN_00007 [Planoprotostelium fungivorum]